MKDMSRRFACLVLALSLCLALLAGCGKDKGGAPDPTPEATKQTFDPVGSSSAEKKKSSFFKRILMVSVTDDHGQSVNAFPQIHISAGEYNPADSCCIVKHDGSPGRSCQAGLPKYR